MRGNTDSMSEPSQHTIYVLRSRSANTIPTPLSSTVSMRIHFTTSPSNRTGPWKGDSGTAVCVRT